MQRIELQNTTYSIGFLDSANHRITCPGAANYTTSIISNFTILVLCKLHTKTLTSGTSHALFSNNAGSVSNNYWAYVSESARNVVVTITNGSSSQTFTSLNSVSTGWNWVGMSYQQGVALNAIINDTVETTAPTLTATADSTRVLNVGSTNSLSRIHGNIARFVIFPGQLSASELRRFVYGGQMPSLSPVLDWKMTNGEGTSVTDSSGNGNTGTLVSGPTWSPVIVPFVKRRITRNIAYSLEFDGVNDYITVTNSSSLNSACGVGQARSFGMWLKTYDPANKVVLEKGANMEHFGIQTNALALSLGVQATTANQQSVGNVIDNNWHLVVCTMSSSSVGRVYIDGKLITTESGWTSTAANSNNLQFGRTAGQVFSGALTKPFIYSRQLTDAEISSMYTDGDYPSSGLIMLLGFTEGAGSSIADVSGNVNNGSISGAVWSSNTPNNSRVITTSRAIASGRTTL